MILTNTYLEPKHFYRKIEHIFKSLERGHPSRSMISDLVSKFFSEFRDSLSLSSAHVYEKSSEEIRQLSTNGNCFSNLSVDILRIFGTSRVVKEIGEFPWIDTLHGRITAILPAEEDDRILIVFVGEEFDPDEDFKSYWATAFSSLHYATVQHLRRRELQDALEQARAIQMSLLPDSRPVFAEYDIAAVSIPAKIVGGDFFDFLQPNSDTLAVAVADAAGHGLPAALQARDVVIGLRMGMERYGNIALLMEKLNRVIHRSGLASRFISLFLGELRKNGDFEYVNAGHPRPLLLDDSGFQELGTGGMILGPRSESSYQTGFTHLSPGSALALFSDGVLEHSSPDGPEFGMDQIRSWMADCRHVRAEVAIQTLLERLRIHGQGYPCADDATVMFLRRPFEPHNPTEKKNLQS